MPPTPLVAGVLHSDHHQALLVVDRRQLSAVLYDGLRETTLRDMAVAFLESLGWDYSLTQAAVPLQRDGWSCGLRVILTLALVLSRTRAGLPCSLPETDFANAVLQTVAAGARNLSAE